MTGEGERGRPWLTLAERLVDEIREPGFTAAVTFASAINARLDSAAVLRLADAAMCLTAGDCLDVLFNRAIDPMARDHILKFACACLLQTLADLGRTAEDMHRDCELDFEEAQNNLAGAVRELRAARARLTAASEDGKGAAEAAVRAAETEVKKWQLTCADCEAALPIIDSCRQRLKHAYVQVCLTDDDFELVYEAALALVRSGHRLPYDGDFLTGEQAPGPVELAAFGAAGPRDLRAAHPWLVKT